MSQKHSTTNKRSFQHLTPYQRGQIQALMEQKLPKTQIAKQVGIARSTLYEELKRGTVDQMRSDLTHYKRYFADTGQLVYAEHWKNSRKPYKLAAAAPFLQFPHRAIFYQFRHPPPVVAGIALLRPAVGTAFRVAYKNLIYSICTAFFIPFLSINSYRHTCCNTL